MKYQMSPKPAFRTDRFRDPVAVSAQVPRLEARPQGPHLDDPDAGPLRLFATGEQEMHGAVMELLAADLERARETLVAAVCEVLRWHGKGDHCYVQDPFGVIFNRWETWHLI